MGGDAWQRHDPAETQAAGAAAIALTGRGGRCLADP